MIWVSSSHPQYKELLSTALTALSSGMKLQAYVYTCTYVPWKGQSLNELTASSSLKIVRY